MHIAGSADQLAKLCAQIYDPFVDLDQIVPRLYCAFFVPEHKRIISKRLDFQIIIKIYQPGNLCIRRSSQKSLVQLSCLTGRADNKPFSVCV